MRLMRLITRGAVIDSGAGEAPWSIAVSLDTSVLEIAGLMQAFRCYAELDEDRTELRLVPIDSRQPSPNTRQLAAFYMNGIPRLSRIQEVNHG